MVRQVKFHDCEDNEILGGILLEDKNTIICGCCGGILKLDENDVTIIKEYDYWVDLSEDIAGDEFDE